MAWTCPAPFYPNHTNYITDREHDGNTRKSWFLVLRAGLFTKQTDAEHHADVLGAPVFTFRTRAEAEAYWAANCRKNHPHKDEVSEEDGSPPPFSTPVRNAARKTTARSAPRSALVNAVRVSVKRESRASVKRQTPVKDEVEEAKTPLFREDGDVSPLSRPRKHPSPVSPLSSRKRSTSCTCSTSASAHSVLPPTPGPDAFPTHTSTEMSASSISSVSSLSASVGSSVSRAVPPHRSVPQHPPSARPAATYLHARGSPSTGMQSHRHAEPPVLFNKSTRTLYKDPATAVREMGKGESVQVLEVEDLEEFLSAPPSARAAT